jgi:hypothetical protein
MIITTRKKKIQSSVCCVRGSGDYNREKKDTVAVWRVVLLCEFLVLAGNWQFFCCGGKVLLGLEKKDTVVCLAGARSLLQPEKKIQSSVCWVRGSGDNDRKKKIQSSVWRVVLLYCVSFWFWWEIGIFFVVAGKFYYDRKKKIQSSVWWVRVHYYDRKKKIQSSVCWVRSSGDYDRKKNIQSSVWRVVLLYCVSFWFWREIGSFLVVAGNFYYDRKKRYSRLSGGCAIIITTGNKKRYSRLSVGCAVLAITTGKKRYSHLSGGLCCCIVFFLVLLYVVSVFGSGGKKVLVQFWFKYVFTT